MPAAPCCKARGIVAADLPDNKNAKFGSPAIFVGLTEWCDKIITRKITRLRSQPLSWPCLSTAVDHGKTTGLQFLEKSFIAYIYKITPKNYTYEKAPASPSTRCHTHSADCQKKKLPHLTIDPPRTISR